ncbi:MAG: four helix bundle protein [Deltaproteobacteria bacterium]|nr:four helix bundle protein [Deltaproteobacteria bacterium]
MRDHTKLRAFELADEVVVLVYQVTARFPKEELYGLTSQMRRAAVSIPSNIVEGCAIKFIEAFGLLAQRGFISD